MRNATHKKTGEKMATIFAKGKARRGGGEENE